MIVVDHNGAYTLIAGERRLRAAKLAGLTKVPVVIRTATDLEQLEIALVENIQRKDLSPLEQARSVQRLKDEFSQSNEKIAERLGKATSTMPATVLPKLWLRRPTATNNTTLEYVDALPHDVKLRITNKIGCEDSIVKTIYPPLSIYMPTAFTPNDDGLNDYFQAIGFGVQKFTLFIYNRWGLLIYKSSDEKEKWEAKGVPDGVYVYKIICEGYDGNILRKTGTITILH